MTVNSKEENFKTFVPITSKNAASWKKGGTFSPYGLLQEKELAKYNCFPLKNKMLTFSMQTLANLPLFFIGSNFAYIQTLKNDIFLIITNFGTYSFIKHLYFRICLIET